jgi:hypothetical protein
MDDNVEWTDWVVADGASGSAKDRTRVAMARYRLAKRLVTDSLNGLLPIQSNGSVPTQSNGSMPIQSNGSVPTQSNGSMPTQSNGWVPTQLCPPSIMPVFNHALNTDPKSTRPLPQGH